jgi:hypothetical protein
LSSVLSMIELEPLDYDDEFEDYVWVALGLA